MGINPAVAMRLFFLVKCGFRNWNAAGLTGNKETKMHLKLNINHSVNSLCLWLFTLLVFFFYSDGEGQCPP